MWLFFFSCSVKRGFSRSAAAAALEVFDVGVSLLPFAEPPVLGDEAGIEEVFADLVEGEEGALEAGMDIRRETVWPVTWAAGFQGRGSGRTVNERRENERRRIGCALLSLMRTNSIIYICDSGPNDHVEGVHKVFLCNDALMAQSWERLRGPMTFSFRCQA